MPSQVPIIPYSALGALHTGTLLARLRRLRECEESFEKSDRAWNFEPEPDPAITGLIEFKNTAVWKQAWLDVKRLLSQREHLPRLPERLERRRQKGRRRPRFGRPCASTSGSRTS